MDDFYAATVTVDFQEGFTEHGYYLTPAEAVLYSWVEPFEIPFAPVLPLL